MTVKLHRINGHDATLAVIQAALEVRKGKWYLGAPSHLFSELLKALERRGFWLGVEERGQLVDINQVVADLEDYFVTQAHREMHPADFITKKYGLPGHDQLEYG